jgi:hypothetical protein
MSYFSSRQDLPLNLTFPNFKPTFFLQPLFCLIRKIVSFQDFPQLEKNPHFLVLNLTATHFSFTHSLSLSLSQAHLQSHTHTLTYTHTHTLTTLTYTHLHTHIGHHNIVRQNMLKIITKHPK